MTIFSQIDITKTDLSQVEDTLASAKEILRSVETAKSFLSLNEHRQLIKEKGLSYDELLDFAACYVADYELCEFENENLKSLLDAQSRLLSAGEHIGNIAEEKMKDFLALSKLHETVATNRRFIEGQLQGRETQRKMHGIKAANGRHSKPGGTRDKQQQIRALWASGKYKSRDICAEQECAALNMSFSSARKALRNTPEPT